MTEPKPPEPQTAAGGAMKPPGGSDVCLADGGFPPRPRREFTERRKGTELVKRRSYAPDSVLRQQLKDLGLKA